MRPGKDIMEQMHHIYLFEALDDNQLQTVISHARQVKLAAKQILFEAGQHAERFYLLCCGQVKLFSLSASGDEKVIEIVTPGKTFGEAIMFMDKHRYPVSAQALEESELLGFDMNSFRQILHESDETCFRLMAGMSRRLHERIDEISNLTLHNATYRLVVFLLEQIPEGAVELPRIHLDIPKSVIASRLSIQPETFSRTLARLSKRNLIHVEGNTIILLDIEGIRALL